MFYFTLFAPEYIVYEVKITSRNCFVKKIEMSAVCTACLFLVSYGCSVLLNILISLVFVVSCWYNFFLYTAYVYSLAVSVWLNVYDLVYTTIYKLGLGQNGQDFDYCLEQNVELH